MRHQRLPLDVRHLFAGRRCAAALTKLGNKSWYFVTVDYAFGHSLEKDASDVVKANGGTVVGSVRHPLNASDFSSFLLQAQASKAQVIGLANGGTDVVNAIKQARLAVGGKDQRLVALLVFLSDVHALGLEAAQGLVYTDGFYWDYDEQTRAFSKRFEAQFKNIKPTMVQAGVYSSVYQFPEGACGRQDFGLEGRGPEDARNPDLRRRHAQRLHPPGWPRDPRHVPVPGQDPGRIQGPVGLPEAAVGDPAQQAFRPMDAACPLVKQ
jgi:branched-chain amino acid transport system substrate-binding protein